MSGPKAQEVPLVIECAADTLLGIIHKPALPVEIGVVTIIAGGPQYRAGVGRGMVSMARDLSAAGIAVLRFDYRGMGDSSGEFRGFEDNAQDLQAAVEAFLQAVPQVRKVVLWGGCDAASAAMIHGWKVPNVSSLVLGNPWVYTPEIETTVRRRHYLSRLGDWSFWRKLLRFEYNLLDYMRGALATVGERASAFFPNAGKEDSVDAPVGGSFVDRMLDGLQRFDGTVLFLISGQSMVSREFDELISSHARWNSVYTRPGVKRIDFPEADQTFSTNEAREAASLAVREWVEERLQSVESTQ